jgi:anti-anti-sigma factor
VSETHRLEISDDLVPDVMLAGEIDMSNAAEIERRLTEALDNDTLGAVVDLSEVTYFDSSGVRMLLSIADRLRWSRRLLAIVAPEESRARRVLQLAGAERLLTFESTRDAAHDRVAAPGGQTRPGEASR